MLTIQRVFPGRALLGRVGGDEFAAIVPGIGTAKEFAALTDGLVQETAKITWQGRELDLRCSVGICSAGCPGVPYDQAYRLADRALYAAKRDGKGRSRVCRQEGTPIIS